MGCCGAAAGRRWMALLLVWAMALSASGEEATGAEAAGTEVQTAPAYQGLWVAEEDGAVWLIEANRILVSNGEGSPEVTSVWETRPGALLVLDGGLTWWSIEDAETGIVLRRPEGDVRLRPASEGTAVPEVVPLEIRPVRGDLEAERIEAIRAELKERYETDQREIKALGRDASDEERERVREMTLRNAEWLKEILAEVGWIDDDVFGPRTTYHAFLLIQHSGDEPLLLGALPLLEEDFKNTDYAQSYALLLDRSRTHMGRPQVYGTQIAQDEAGGVLLPMVEPSKVDERLAALGLPPHADYLADASKYLLDGEPVRMWEERELPPIP